MFLLYDAGNHRLCALMPEGGPATPARSERDESPPAFHFQWRAAAE
jgi:hypothetical protein